VVELPGEEPIGNISTDQTFIWSPVTGQFVSESNGAFELFKYRIDLRWCVSFAGSFTNGLRGVL